MNKLETKAVADLKELIRKIENGEFKITDSGLSNRIEYSNVSTDKGLLQVWETSYSIRHIKKE